MPGWSDSAEALINDIANNRALAELERHAPDLLREDTTCQPCEAPFDGEFCHEHSSEANLDMAAVASLAIEGDDCDVCGATADNPCFGHHHDLDFGHDDFDIDADDEDFLDLGFVPATSPRKWFDTADLAEYVLREPDSIFVCPPEWGIGPREFRDICSKSRPFSTTGAHLWGSFLGATGGPLAVLAGQNEVWSAAAIFGVWGASGAGLFYAGMRHIRACRRRYASLDLHRVVEVPDAPDWVVDIAELADPGTQLLDSMWKLAGSINDNPELFEHKPEQNAAEWLRVHFPAAIDITDQNSLDSYVAERLGDGWQIETLTYDDRIAVVTRVTGASVSRPQPAVIEPPKPSRWQVARARFEVVELEWEAILLDPLSALDHSSLLGDVGKPLPAAFLLSFAKAKETLARLIADGVDEPSPVDVEVFEDAARAAAVNWDAAKHWAEHVGYAWLPEHERIHASTAQKLLAVAKDEDGATLAERVNAAEKAAKLLRRIHSFAMPPQSVEKLALMARPQIEAGESVLREEPQRVEAESGA